MKPMLSQRKRDDVVVTTPPSHVYPHTSPNVCLQRPNLNWHKRELGRGTLGQQWDFHGGSDSKASAYNAGDPGSIPGSGRSPGEGMATHSSILAWKIPWTEEPGGLQSRGSQRVWHDWATSLSLSQGKQSRRGWGGEGIIRVINKIRGHFCDIHRKTFATHVLSLHQSKLSSSKQVPQEAAYSIFILMILQLNTSDQAMYKGRPYEVVTITQLTLGAY